MKDNLCGKKCFPQSCKDEMRESAVDGQINVLRLCQRRFFQNRQYFAVDSSKEYLPTQVAFHVAKSSPYFTECAGCGRVQSPASCPEGWVPIEAGAG